MKMKLSLLALSMAMAVPSLAAIFTEDFENLNLGVLDKNWATGENAAPNGSGQPWFGPAPPNGTVIVQEEGLPAPHSGTKMLRGRLLTGGPDLDQNWVNVAYRFNGGAAYTGAVYFEAWMYDPVGPGATTIRDYIALGFYNTAPTDTDHPASGSLNSGVSQIQRISLGASNSLSGIDNTVYQARVVGLGTAAGAYNANGYFNLTGAPRSIGWHRLRIVAHPRLADGKNYVSFFIDDMSNALLTLRDPTGYGYNVIELNTLFGPQSSFMDDVLFDSAPTISGTLNLGSYSGTMPTLTAEVLDPLGTTVQRFAGIPVAADGTFSFSTTLRGDYRIAVKPSHWLRAASGLQTIGEAGVSGLTFAPINGDTDGDNDVDIDDYDVLANAYGSFAGDPTYAANADLDGDGDVDIDDYDILANAYGLFGD